MLSAVLTAFPDISSVYAIHGVMRSLYTQYLRDLSLICRLHRNNKQRITRGKEQYPHPRKSKPRKVGDLNGA